MAGSASVIITVRNEEAHIADLLASLVGQGAKQVILVDAKSTDDTVKIAQGFADKLPLEIIVEPCSRGAGRNIGAAAATGSCLAFIDGDCIAGKDWQTLLAAAVKPKTIAAGHTKSQGPYPARRVPVMVGSTDVTWPSCNLAISKSLFDQLGGFDATFETAEDVDLNLRAVHAGARIVEVPEAIVTARTRQTLVAHLRQAFSYGIGRRQLERKHPGLPVAKRRAALAGHKSVKGLMRLGAGYFGYAFGRRGSQ